VFVIAAIIVERFGSHIFRADLGLTVAAAGGGSSKCAPIESDPTAPTYS
jgi:hypothetical protein